jgi:VanZ family protein
MKRISKYLSRRWVAITWTVIIFILLAMPGSVIPKEPTFTIPQFDKFIHIVLFGGFVFLWSFYYSRKNFRSRKLSRLFFLIFIISCAYGIGMEYVQKYFIPGRDYDQGDIIADMMGAALAYGICNIRLTGIDSVL